VTDDARADIEVRSSVLVRLVVERVGLESEQHAALLTGPGVRRAEAGVD
jgi:hypothetical protein